MSSSRWQRVLARVSTRTVAVGTSLLGSILQRLVAHGPFTTPGRFALERRTDFIKIWFWDRKSKNVPPSIREGMVKLYTDSWVSFSSASAQLRPPGVLHRRQLIHPLHQGAPVAYFPNTTCDMTKHFTDHHIILNLNFCALLARPYSLQSFALTFSPCRWRLGKSDVPIDRVPVDLHRYACTLLSGCSADNPTPLDRL